MPGKYSDPKDPHIEEGITVLPEGDLSEDERSDADKAHGNGDDRRDRRMS